MVLLITSDSQEIHADKDVITRSAVVRKMLDSHDADEKDDMRIPLPNVNGEILEKVLAYCEHYRNDPLPDPEVMSQRESYTAKRDMSEWDKNYFDVDKNTLFEMILAANHLEIEDLLDGGCMTVAKMLVNKTPQQIRNMFGLVNDFTPEEDEQIKRENEWAENQ